MTSTPAHRPSIVVAPDKFKGSATAVQAAEALARGLRAAMPQADVVELPTADGGEGTVDMFLHHGFSTRALEVSGPLGEAIASKYAYRDQTAIIEMAAAAGLGLLPGAPSPQTAMRASTRGVGELVADALDHGCTRIIITAGGSATTDGGAGALSALGLQLLTVEGDTIPVGGEGLLEISRISSSDLDPRLSDVELILAGDVDSPLTGPLGAARMFGPQKGASPADVEALEAALCYWADVVAEFTGVDIRERPGTGAAGGFAFGLAALLGAHLVPASSFLLELLGFFDTAQRSDLVIVGEGSLDQQSLRGKGPVDIARTLARLGGPPVLAVAGECQLSLDELRAAGIHSAYELNSLEPDRDVSMARAPELLERLGRTIATHGIDQVR